MLKNKRLLLLTLLFIAAAILVLGMKIAYPLHRALAFGMLGLGIVPLAISYQLNRRLLRIQKHLVKKKARPFLPHAIVGFALIVAFYVTWALFPVETSPLAGMSADELEAEIDTDLESYIMLRNAADDIVGNFRESGLLQRDVATMDPVEREEIRRRWQEGATVFFEFDLLKDKYRGFYQIDYVAEPVLHADAFMLAYMVYIAQYKACLDIVEMVGENEFMETLLNEEMEGIPAESYFHMKQRLTNPIVMLRLNAAAAYHELIKKDVSIDEEIIADFEARRRAQLKSLGKNADLFVDNPLVVLEHAAFETVLPIQKNVAVQMSYIRTARRDYLITPEILARHQTKLRPGDILIQRRNWHMTNIGIPGFWPHVALYVGTPEEIDAYFEDIVPQPSETLKSLYPEAFRALSGRDGEGYPFRVIEAIRPGVVFQSLETSARCDYLGVIRPNIGKAEIFKGLMGAFSHHGKAYDLNFDFTTDNELVCSELVYKAYKAGGKLPLKPEIINGRLLLPPNRLAEQVVEQMGPDGRFSFVLFLDAVEESDLVVERDADAFMESWRRPKWDILQQ